MVTVLDDILYYNGIQFNKYSGRYVKKEYQKTNIIQFRCKNSRKDERFRKGKGNFCNAEIILETNKQNTISEQKFIMTKDHSLDCKNLELLQPKIKMEINKWEEFKDLCLNFLEKTDSYDNKYLLKEFNKIYQNGEYKFLNDDKKMLKIKKLGKEIVLNLPSLVYSIKKI